MIYKSDQIADLLDQDTSDFRVIPCPGLAELRAKGDAALDLRLGRWFTTFRQTRIPFFPITHEGDPQPSENELTKRYFVPFGGKFYLHPNQFVLGITLEWVALPANISGYITGKSSWGRRGLIIETAAGIHPGFSGCLTLELTNVGEIPIEIEPGMKICQVFFHEAKGNDIKAQSVFDKRRRPTLGYIAPDAIMAKLKKPL